MKIYLAGAIEAAPDGGKTWRQALTPFLENTLEADVFDPSIKEKEFLTEEEKVSFREWKVSDYKRFKGVISRIIDRDLDQLINRSDMIICLWDEYVLSGGGTHGELTVAYEHNIPVYMVTDMPINHVSSWILGCATEVFTSFEELKERLLEITGFKGVDKDTITA